MRMKTQIQFALVSVMLKHKEYVKMQRCQQDKVQCTRVPYISISEDSIVQFPSLPSMPIQLSDWYDNNCESFVNLNQQLNNKLLKHFRESCRHIITFYVDKYLLIVIH